VLDPGLLASVQDLGRPGHASIGVPAGGAADQVSLRAVNAVLGNEPGAAAIELTLTGGAFRFGCDACFALGGATGEAWVERADGERREVCWWTSTQAAAGDALRIAHSRVGVRVYLGISGGVRTPAVFGSRSTHIAAGFPRLALKAGDAVPIIEARDAARDLHMVTPSDVARRERDVFRMALRVLSGPHAEMFDAVAMERLLAEEFTISSESSRTGVRLRATPALPAPTTSLLTQPMGAGCIQVPSGGQPIILGRDHPTTGGYPVLASVISADLDAVGQLRPGRTVRFERVTMDEARRAWRERVVP
jgi:biotin-dependent carboxylase-like uncharacterized protein